jgi:hypothetical protein
VRFLRRSRFAFLSSIGLVAIMATVLGFSTSAVDEDYEFRPCPSPLNSNSSMWIELNNVGPARIWFRAPQYIHTRATPYYVKYVPSSIDPFQDVTGRTWMAEGPYWAQCIKPFQGVGYHAVVPVPGSFEGTVWPLEPPPDEEECEEDDGEMDELRAPSAVGRIGKTGRGLTMTTANTCGSGGGGGDGTAPSDNCTTQWGVIEVSYDGGSTWEVLWSGYYTECEE